MLRDGSLQILYLIQDVFLLCKKVIKLYIFTLIILSWKHKYRKRFAIARFYIVNIFRVTDLSISPDQYSRQYWRNLPFLGWSSLLYGSCLQSYFPLIPNSISLVNDSYLSRLELINEYNHNISITKSKVIQNSVC